MAQTLVSMLRNNPVFAAAKTTTLNQLARAATLEAYRRGQDIFAAGDAADAVFVLHEGVVRVFHAHGSGRELTVKHLAAPTTFGEMEVLTERIYLESTRALDSVRLLRLPRDAFVAFIDAEPASTGLLLRDVCARFCVAARNEHASFFDVPTRLASFLLSYADLFGRPATAGLRIHAPLTQEDMADALGVAVRSVARALLEFKEKGLVERRRGWWVIRDAKALTELCGGWRFNLNYRFQLPA